MNTVKEKKKISRARKTSTLQTKIYSYGALAPNAQDSQIIRQQLWLGYQYRRAMVAAERTRRAEFRQLRQTLSPELGVLEQSRLELETQYEELRQKLPKKAQRTPEQMSEMKHLTDQMRQTDEKISSLKREVDKQYFTQFDAAYKKLYRLRQLESKAIQSPAAAELLRQQEDSPAFWKKVQEVLNTPPKVGPRTLTTLRAAVDESIKNDAYLFPQSWRDKQEIEARHHQQLLTLRSQCQCFVGTYLAVEKAAQVSFDKSPFQPRFPQYDRTGCVGVQLGNKGLSVAQVLQGTERVHIIVHDNQVVTGYARGARAATAKLSLAGSSNKRTVVHINFLLHRPLPEDGQIKEIYFFTKRIGNRFEYQLQFTLEAASLALPILPSEEILALHLGWRVLNNGDIQVASLWDGKQEEKIQQSLPIEKQCLILPASLRGQTQASLRLQKHCDDHFDVAKIHVRDWLKENNQLKQELVESSLLRYEEGLREEKRAKLEKNLNSIHSWRNHQHLRNLAHACRDKFLTADQVADLWQKWKNERHCYNRNKASRALRLQHVSQDLFAPLGEIQQFGQRHGLTSEQQMSLYLQWWLRKDIHLTDWFRSAEKKVRRHIENIYRVFAKKLASQYQMVLVQKTSLSRVAQAPRPEDDQRTPQEENSDTVRQWAGVSNLKKCLSEAFGKQRYQEQSTPANSLTHSNCGGRPSQSGNKSEQQVTCDKCGKSFDQDQNAARAMWLASGSVSTNPPGALAA